MKAIAKMVAKWLLGYVPEAVVSAVEYVNSATANAAYREEVLMVVEHLSADIELIANAMQDGEVSEEEMTRIKEMVETDVVKIKELL